MGINGNIWELMGIYGNERELMGMNWKFAKLHELGTVKTTRFNAILV